MKQVRNREILDFGFWILDGKYLFIKLRCFPVKPQAYTMPDVHCPMPSPKAPERTPYDCAAGAPNTQYPIPNTQIHRIFNVISAKRFAKKAIIQKRTMILFSGHCFISKWW